MTWITVKWPPRLKLIGLDEMRHAEMFAERIKELERGADQR